jgi:hypothetical protein
VVVEVTSEIVGFVDWIRPPIEFTECGSRTGTDRSVRFTENLAAYGCAPEHRARSGDDPNGTSAVAVDSWLSVVAETT